MKKKAMGYINMRKASFVLIVSIIYLSVYWAASPHVNASQDWDWPLENAVFSYSNGKPLNFQNHPNNVGIDLLSSSGNKVIYAVADGVVTGIGTGCKKPVGKNTNCSSGNYGCTPNVNTYNSYCNYGMGNGVIIKHTPLVNNKVVYAEYAHMTSVYVSKGDTVKKGQAIGYMGNSGMSFGSHLHFGMRINVPNDIFGNFWWNSTPIDPEPLFSDTSTSITVSLTPPTNATYKSKEKVGDTTATVVSQITKSYGSNITQSGVYLYDANNNYLAKHTPVVDNVPASMTTFHSWYEIGVGLEFDYALKPGTKYYYEFRVTVNGKEYKGAKRTFTTTGTAPITRATFSKPTDPTYVAKEKMSETTATVVTKINKPAGLEVDVMQVFLFDSTGKSLGSYEHDITNVSASSTFFHAWYEIGKGLEFDYQLTPGTTYQYRFTLWSKNPTSTHRSETMSFTTTGKQKTSLDVWTKYTSYGVPFSGIDYDSTGEISRQIHFKPQGAADTSYSTNVPTELGSYTVKVVSETASQIRTGTASYFIGAATQAPAITTTKDVKSGETIDLSNLVSGAMGEVSFSISGDANGSTISGNNFIAGSSGMVKLNVNITGYDAGGSPGFEYSPYTSSEAITINIQNSGVKLVGSVAISGAQREITVQLFDVNDTERLNPLYTITIPVSKTKSSSSSQPFELQDVTPGTYDMVVSKQGHVSVAVTGLVVGSQDIMLNESINSLLNGISLPAGDVNGDGWVNFDDIFIVINASNYRKKVGETGVNPSADVNGDTWINFDDLFVIINANNYRQGNITIPFS